MTQIAGLADRGDKARGGGRGDSEGGEEEKRRERETERAMI